MNFNETKFGFDYGALSVERWCSDEKKGWVVIGLKTPRAIIEVYVTKTGKVTVIDRKKVKVLK